MDLNVNRALFITFPHLTLDYQPGAFSVTSKSEKVYHVSVSVSVPAPVSLSPPIYLQVHFHVLTDKYNILP